MDRTVYVVGTLHRYQGRYNINSGQVATKAELEQFKRFLKEIISQLSIRWIAEEMSVEALVNNRHPDLPSGESVPFQVSGELRLAPHGYCCAPDRATREKLGLSPDGTPDTPDDQKKRETYWLEQLEKRNSFPCLFVLGSSHADTFTALLKKSQLTPVLLIEEWKPATS